MRRGSLTVAVISTIGGIAALATAVLTDQLVSPTALLGGVLLFYAALRFAVARGG